jgi:monoamine oxidase
MLRQRLAVLQQRSCKLLVAHYSTDTSIASDIATRYREYLNEKTQPLQSPTPRSNLNNVAIVGAGMSGLYSALLLKKHGLDVKIFEATDRVGGRVYTHWFEDKKNQYFEAGAMRLPVVKWQKPVFDLINDLNKRLPDFPINLIPYHNSWPSGNRVYVNGTKQKDNNIMTVDYANQHLDELGFPLEADVTEEAGKMLLDAISPVAKELLHDVPTALKKYDCMTLHHYLSTKCSWSDEKINYVEVMFSQTNDFFLGLIDQVLHTSSFTGEVAIEMKTIDQGMSRLPEAMAKVIGEENIIYNAPIQSLKYLNGGRVEIGYSTSDQKVRLETFDAVILALPPNSIRMIPNKPIWSVTLEHGLRAIHFEPVYKIALRFKSRFWEREDLRPSKGGQSITDLPCRWVVYPSYGIGDKNKGVLLLYSWMGDSDNWLTMSSSKKVMLALNNLQVLYPEVDVYGEYCGGSPDGENYLKEALPVHWPFAAAFFHPSQFSYLYPVMKQPQGQIFFTGEHLGMFHTWMASALDSAKDTVGQVLGLEVEHL